MNQVWHHARAIAGPIAVICGWLAAGIVLDALAALLAAGIVDL